jgi:type II secretory ATPase GspE/PulE/Tfp pilus assembly ATPase PilB-like protein
MPRPTVAALRAYAALLKKTGKPLPTSQTLSAAEWLPLALIGPVLVVAHFHPGAPLYLLEQLTQPVIVSPEDYRVLHENFRVQIDFLHDVAKDYDDTMSSWEDAKRVGPGVELSALMWIESMGLVQNIDRGMVKTALSAEQHGTLQVSPDYLLAIAHITQGSLIGRFDLGKFSAPVVEGLTTQLCERHKIHPFWSDGRTNFIYSAGSNQDQTSDFLASRAEGRCVIVSVSRESLALFQQGEDSRLDRHSTAQNTAENAQSSAKVLYIDPREMERVDPRHIEDNQVTTHWILWDAVRKRANDIHIEVDGASLLVRNAIDSTGVPTLRLARTREPGVSVVLKTLAGIDLDGVKDGEGSFTYCIASGRTIDVRVSLLISERGVKWTLRLFDKSVGIRTLSQLGLQERDTLEITRAVRKPHGLILFAGPTGHGKSTTLNAALGTIISPEKFIYTLEDPVEFDIPGVIQLTASANPKNGGRSFAEGISKLLRADPDVILVQEIRDRATVEAALGAAQTGHLVKSTVHSNGACSLIQRIKDLGGDPSLLATTLRMAASQRLVRKLCHCMGCEPISDEQQELFESHGLVAPRYIHLKTGCQDCHHTGFFGRVAVLEFLPLTPDVRKAIASQSDLHTLKAVALKDGFRTLFTKGLEIVAAGVTTIEEIESVCADE